MKKHLFNLAVLVLSSAPVFAAEPEVQLLEKATITEVRLVPTNAGFNPDFHAVNIYVNVTAGNACLMPTAFAKAVQKSVNLLTYNFFKFVDNTKMCPMNYRPVSKMILVDTLRSLDEIPEINVNGIRASFLHTEFQF